MRRTALFAAALLACIAARARAHGPAVGAQSVLARSRGEVTLVRLTRGLAHRAGAGFRFVCPESWGGDVTARAASMGDGLAVVGAEALHLVDAEGRARPHPAQVGTTIALTSGAGAVFAIVQREGRQQLHRITESASTLLRDLDETFASIAATDSSLALLGWEGASFVLQRLSFAGELERRITWQRENAIADAELRSAGRELYVVAWGTAAPWVTLGRIAQAYEPLAIAGGDIAGPVVLGSGAWVARDGALQRLDSDAATLGAEPYVACLGAHLDLPYACVGGDLWRIEENGLAGPLFELSSLREPDLRDLTGGARRSCMLRWLDVQADLASETLSRSEDASTASPGSEPTTPLEPSGEVQSDGCGLSARGERPFTSLALLFAVALACARRRRYSAAKRLFAAPSLCFKSSACSSSVDSPCNTSR